MKPFLAAFVGGGIALIAGCASTPKITSDFLKGTDYSHYKTFALVERVGMGAAVNSGPILTAKVHAAATQSLMIKGFAPANPVQADFLVVVQGRLTPHVDITRYGYGLPVGRAWRYGGTAGPGWEDSTEAEVMVSNTGRLAVDIIDRRSKELVWRGTARKDNVTAQPDPDRIAIVVGLILKGFPPSLISDSEK